MPEIIGLVPAAGQSLRVAPLPCSKEIFPVGIDRSDPLKGPRPKVAAQFLLEQMQVAGAGKTYIILRDGKWDIPEYFNDGSRFDLDIAYLMMRHPYGVPFTLDQAYPFVKTATILFGFPDIIIYPKSVYLSLLDKLNTNGCDIVLGLFPAHRPQKMDMVEMDENRNILSITIKPERTNLEWTWIAAVWSPNFTKFMHGLVSERLAAKDVKKELFLGDVIQSAIDNKMNVSSVLFKNGRYLDIGTPEDLAQATEFVASDQDHN